MNFCYLYFYLYMYLYKWIYSFVINDLYIYIYIKFCDLIILVLDMCVWFEVFDGNGFLVVDVFLFVGFCFFFFY